MKTQTQKFSSDAAASSLRGVLLYEDREAYARALDMYAYLAVEVSKEIPLQFSWWAFRGLNENQSASAARLAVAGADLVIVSAKPAADWSAAFKRWIESWRLPKSKRLSALGALLSPRQPTGASQCGRQIYLHQVATRMGLDFLTVATETPAASRKAERPLVPDVMPFELEPVAVMDHPDYSPFCGVND